MVTVTLLATRKNWNHSCPTSLFVRAHRWTDVFGTECSVKILSFRPSSRGDFSRRAHNIQRRNISEQINESEKMRKERVVI